ncbi:S-adenosyl-L-methionine-dependent methyltransferase [Polyplosphaeria fusca]|uniref:S-adenosyl-L-methionine-dependent methyltransferase n=1 Tax=Polyplosphaeria fusca TaxID=682080 RepID=A0A9P4V034_9PLEO|nr:S-adenosyl-L-methionine-dependent methyltransferase [Polyplosphaeria fusca]
MSTPGALAGLQTFDPLNIAYETAYADNPLKKSCIAAAISQLPPSSHVLDMGCGTGVPVSQLLASANHTVTGVDISPNMIAHAASRVRGTFLVADMLTYVPSRNYAAVFLIFSHLQLRYAELHGLALRLASALDEGGLFVLGQMPGDSHVREGEWGDGAGTWVEEYDAPFMGEMLPTLMLSRAGQRKWLESMGLEVVWEEVGMFQPKDERCVPEEQQYLIARRRGEVRGAEPAPR